MIDRVDKTRTKMRCNLLWIIVVAVGALSLPMYNVPHNINDRVPHLSDNTNSHQQYQWHEETSHRAVQSGFSFPQWSQASIPNDVSQVPAYYHNTNTNRSQGGYFNYKQWDAGNTVPINPLQRSPPSSQNVYSSNGTENSDLLDEDDIMLQSPRHYEISQGLEDSGKVTTARSRKSKGIWKDLYPRQTKEMVKAIAERVQKSSPAIYQRLNKKCNDEIAHKLMSNNDEKIWEAIHELGIKQKGNTKRLALLGTQADSITETFAQRTKMSKPEARSMLNYWIDEDSARLLLDPSTFEAGVDWIYRRRGKSSQGLDFSGDSATKSGDSDFDVDQFLADDLDFLGMNLEQNHSEATSSISSGHQEDHHEDNGRKAIYHNGEKVSIVKKYLGDDARKITKKLMRFHNMPDTATAWKRLQKTLEANPEVASYLLDDNTFEKVAAMISYKPLPGSVRSERALRRSRGERSLQNLM